MFLQTHKTFVVNTVHQHHTHVSWCSRDKCQRLTQKRRNCWITILFLFFCARKKYSCCFITLRLNHCSHMDYFNNVFLGLENGNNEESLHFIKNIFICVFNVLRVWNNMRVSNYWQKCNFWVNQPFGGKKKFAILTIENDNCLTGMQQALLRGYVHGMRLWTPISTSRIWLWTPTFCHSCHFLQKQARYQWKFTIFYSYIDTTAKIPLLK